MSIQATLISNLSVSETLESGVDAASRKTIVHDQFNDSKTMNASSTVPGTKVVADNIALVAGAKTLDLTALTGTNGAAVDFTGLKVQAIKFRNPAANAIMTFSKGASNGYGFGSGGATFTVPVPPGGSVLFYFPDNNPDVAAGAKDIDVAGTGTQTFDYELVAG